MTGSGAHGPRVRAPELAGAGGWIGTGGAALSLAGLRGRVVVLDFWTSCCVNCLHVIDELRELEHARADVLTVVGVHSPKFAHEQDHAAVVAAVERLGLSHPVLDDPGMVTWRQYAVKAWPTLAVIDPEGYLVAVMAGEGHGAGLAALVDELVATARERGTLSAAGAPPYVPEPQPDGPLRFPAGILALPDGSLLVADPGAHRVLRLAPGGPERPDGTAELATWGDGARGLADGPAASARFAEPTGLALLPPDVAAALGVDVVVADTANHAIRGLSLAGDVRTLAGTGRQRAVTAPETGPALAVDLSSPWDVAWWRGRVVIAMAGIHQLWQLDVARGVVAPLAGTGVESLSDGPAREAWMAQPSGLAADPARDRLWIVDAETSALRWLDGPDGDEVLHTAVGEGLFDFGHRDGPARQALLQHPLGVTVLPDGGIAVLDTYNGAVRRYDPVADTVTTLVAGLAEPMGAAVTADGAVWVTESTGHRVSRPLVPGVEAQVTGPAQRTERPASAVGPGPVRLEVVFTAAPGQKLDTAEGPATRLTVSASPPELLLAGGGTGTDLGRDLVLAAGIATGTLHVTATAATCDADAEYPACHLTTQDWGVPLTVAAGGPDRLALVLRGLDETR